MKYSVRYNKDFKSIEKVDEIIINYNKKDITLLDFIEENKNKRIILEVNIDEDITLLEELCNKYDNLIIKFLQYDENKIENIINSKIKYFFDIKVDNWDTFIGLVNLKVSDVYIVNELGFELDKISVIAHSQNINIRVIPNIAQSSWNNTIDYKKFFIRPEDIEYYENFIDICELYGQNLDILLKVYKEDKKWFGKLNELIIGIKDDTLDGKYITSEYVFKRISCGKKCQKGNSCSICDNIIELSKTFEKNQMAILNNKNK